jgi:hypothetical protein
MYLRGTSGTGGTSSDALRVETSPSAVEGRIFELLGELRSVWNSPPPCVRFGVVGEVAVASETPGIRIEGSDFLRDMGVTGPPSGDVAREGEDGAVGIGGCGIGGCGYGVSATAGRWADGGSPRPGGRAGSESSNEGISLAIGAFVALAGEPATVTSGTVGSAGTFMPNNAGSRSTAW